MIEEQLLQGMARAQLNKVLDKARFMYIGGDCYPDEKLKLGPCLLIDEFNAFKASRGSHVFIMERYDKFVADPDIETIHIHFVIRKDKL